jgi:hypothetical protein
MPSVAQALNYLPSRQRVVTMRDGTVYPVDDAGNIIDDLRPSIMYGDPDAIGERDLAELLTIPGFSDDDAEPADHNIFDMLVPGCPARPEGLSCEPAGGIGPCRHCGKAVG